MSLYTIVRPSTNQNSGFAICHSQFLIITYIMRINLHLSEMFCCVVLVAQNGEFQRFERFVLNVTSASLFISRLSGNVQHKPTNPSNRLNSPFSATETTQHNFSDKSQFILIRCAHVTIEEYQDNMNVFDILKHFFQFIHTHKIEKRSQTLCPSPL